MSVRKRSKRVDGCNQNPTFEGWNKLPTEIWNMILKRLSDDDLSSFRYACYKPGFPCLIIPHEDHPRRLRFFNILEERTIHDLKTKIPQGRYTVNGCWDGWLTITHTEYPSMIQLQNPFSKRVKNLPSSVREFKKVIPSSSSTSSYGFIAIGLSYDDVLYFCRPNKDYIWTWIQIESKFESWSSTWSDFTFYKGKFYALKFNGDVYLVEGLDGYSPTIKLVAEAHAKHLFYGLTMCHYLLESFGDLLRVMRMKNNVFKVFNLDFSRGYYKWEEVENLGDCSLFVGSDVNRSSCSVKASDFVGCRENSIYYILNSYEQPRYGLGIFSLKDGTTQRFSLKGIAQDRCIEPIWCKLA